MAFTEFFCDASAGDNLNGGGIAAGTVPGAPITYAGGAWVVATGIFTPVTGNPASDGVAVGDFASVCTDAQTGAAVFVGRVTARDATTITISLTAKSGTAPAGTTGITCRVGGKWKGPNGAVLFPFGFITAALTNSGGSIYRVNLVDTNSYAITASLVHAVNGPGRFEGYHSTPGDNAGFAVIDGSTNAITIIDMSGAAYVDLANIKVVSSATSGTGVGIYQSGDSYSFRLIATGTRSAGFRCAGFAIVEELEAYNCNLSEGGLGAVYAGNPTILIRPYIHDNNANMARALYLPSNATIIGGIVESNRGTACVGIQADSRATIIRTDVYNNTSDGVLLNGSGFSHLIENCNLVGNTGYGINGSTGIHTGAIVNCAFGVGTQANSGGDTNGLSGMNVIGKVLLPTGTTPWNAPTTGDFRIVGASCKGTGRGSFTETDGTNTGTVAYPDIGAGQGSSAGSGGGLLLNPGLSGGLR